MQEEPVSRKARLGIFLQQMPCRWDCSPCPVLSYSSVLLHYHGAKWEGEKNSPNDAPGGSQAHRPASPLGLQGLTEGPGSRPILLGRLPHTGGPQPPCANSEGLSAGQSQDNGWATLRSPFLFWVGSCEWKLSSTVHWQHQDGQCHRQHGCLPDMASFFLHCCGLYLDVPSKLHALIDMVSRRWLDYRCVILDYEFDIRLVH